MYKDIFESIRNEAEKRNLRERTIQLYCSDVSYFLRWIGKNVSDLTLEDAESFLTAKRLEGRSPETHNHYRSALYSANIVLIVSNLLIVKSIICCKNQKHFNQFTMSLLFCVILFYIISVPLFLPLSEFVNTYGTI